MTISPEQDKPTTVTSAIWPPEAVKALTDMCQSEGLNPVRLRKLVDRYVDTRRKPSRQELIDALKHRPRIQERAMVLSSVTKQLNAFIDTLNSDDVVR